MLTSFSHSLAAVGPRYLDLPVDEMTRVPWLCSRGLIGDAEEVVLRCVGKGIEASVAEMPVCCRGAKLFDMKDSPNDPRKLESTSTALG